MFAPGCGRPHAQTTRCELGEWKEATGEDQDALHGPLQVIRRA